jgi:hypothetical protein
MKIERINYQKVFPLGQYINEKLGVEIQLDEGDDFDAAMLAAKEMIEKFHIQNNPQLYSKGNNIAAIADYIFSDKPHREEPSIQVNDDRKKVKQSPEEKRWEAIIEACCSEKEVEKWRKKVPESLQHLCDTRIKKLNVNV